MSWSINRGICQMVGVHAQIDESIQAQRRQYVAASRRPLAPTSGPVAHIEVQRSIIAAQVCAAAVSLGCGISIGAALRAQAGQCFESYHLGFMTKGRGGTFVQLATTTALTAVKVGLMLLGAGVVAPAMGTAVGLYTWSQAATSFDDISPARGEPGSAPVLEMNRTQKRPRMNGSQLREVMARHRARTAAAL